MPLLSGLYCYPTLVRDVATWGKVKQSSDGLKHKCEMFDTAADSSKCRATPMVQEVLVRATRRRDLVLHLATQETLESQETAANLVALRVGWRLERNPWAKMSYAIFPHTSMSSKVQGTNVCRTVFSRLCGRTMEATSK